MSFVVIVDDDFLSPHQLSAWKCIDSVRRHETLVSLWSQILILYIFFLNRSIVANIFLGLRLPHLDTEFGVYFMIAFCVGLVPIIPLEIYVMRGKKQEGKM